MQTTKTAISIQKALFEKADALARSMRVSRSRLIALALEEYIRRQENGALLAEINAAYSEEPDIAEETLRRKARSTHRRVVEREK